MTKKIVSQEWAQGFHAAAEIVQHVEKASATPSILQAITRSPSEALRSYAEGFKVDDRDKPPLYAIEKGKPPRIVSEWLPIDSAPKKKRVLIYEPNEALNGWYDVASLEPCLDGRERWLDPDGEVSCKAPTHWMPLPEPPEEK